MQNKGTLSAVSTNPSKTKVMIGGRNCLCILNLNGVSSEGSVWVDSQKMHKNLRGKKSGLSASALQIEWNQLNEDHVIYSAVNSTVNLLDSKSGKVVNEYAHHENKTFLDWSPRDPKLFISGSYD